MDDDISGPAALILVLKKMKNTVHREYKDKLLEKSFRFHTIQFQWITVYFCPAAPQVAVTGYNCLLEEYFIYSSPFKTKRPLWQIRRHRRVDVCAGFVDNILLSGGEVSA